MKLLVPLNQPARAVVVAAIVVLCALAIGVGATGGLPDARAGDDDLLTPFLPLPELQRRSRSNATQGPTLTVTPSEGQRAAQGGQ